MSDMIGEKFGFFTVLKRVEAPKVLKKKYIYYLCKCDCGNEQVIRGSSLRSDRPKCEKCGLRNRNDRARIYNIWYKIIERCYNEKDDRYNYYGYKGVCVSDRWRDFENFYNDNIEEYKTHVDEHGEDNTTIDRIDSNGNYESSNCRWATIMVQVYNRSNTINVEIKDKSYTLMELSDIYNIEYSTLQDRHKRGWRGEKLIQKVRNKNQKNRGNLELEINNIKYDDFTSVVNDYPFLSLATIINRYDKGLRGEYLVKIREFYYTKEGKEVVSSLEKQSDSIEE